MLLLLSFSCSCCSRCFLLGLNEATSPADADCTQCAESGVGIPTNSFLFGTVRSQVTVTEVWFFFRCICSFRCMFYLWTPSPTAAFTSCFFTDNINILILICVLKFEWFGQVIHNYLSIQFRRNHCGGRRKNQLLNVHAVLQMVQGFFFLLHCLLSITAPKQWYGDDCFFIYI